MRTTAAAGVAADAVAGGQWEASRFQWAHAWRRRAAGWTGLQLADRRRRGTRTVGLGLGEEPLLLALGRGRRVTVGGRNQNELGTLEF